jgi:2-polyprenyl-3-methyl-5-hydroxy-6-metoxy-1,4-benzoquinol methylase
MTTGSQEFDQYARDYKSMLDRSVKMSGDGAEYFCEYKACYVARAVGARFSGKILDFGCGIGLLSACLKKHLPAANVHGYDPSPESIRLVPQVLSTQGRFSDRIEDLDDDYKLAVLSNVMHHIAQTQREQTIMDIAAHLAPGGRLILFEHNPWNPLSQWVVQHCPFDKGAVLLLPAEVSAYFARAALTVRKHDYIVFFPKMLSALRALEPWLSWLPAGAQYAVVGEKHGGEETHLHRHPGIQRAGQYPPTP